MTVLDQNLKSVLRTTSGHLKKLAELNICTLRDLLMYFPRKYEYQRETNIAELRPAEKQVIKGVISNFSSKRIRGMDIFSLLITDKTGCIEVVWFNQPYIRQKLSPGDEVTLAGKVKFDYYARRPATAGLADASKERSNLYKLSMKNPITELKKDEKILGKV